MNLSAWLPLIVVFIVIFIIRSIYDRYTNRAVNTGKLPFIKKINTLSESEKVFFQFLENLSTIKDNYYIFPQLSISKLVTLPISIKRNYALINKIDRKSVDFVLFDKNTLNPIVAIELDGASHNAIDRQERDEFVDKVFESAGVRLVHIERNDNGYNPEEILKIIGL